MVANLTIYDDAAVVLAPVQISVNSDAYKGRVYAPSNYFSVLTLCLHYKAVLLVFDEISVVCWLLRDLSCDVYWMLWSWNLFGNPSVWFLLSRKVLSFLSCWVRYFVVFVILVDVFTCYWLQITSIFLYFYLVLRLLLTFCLFLWTLFWQVCLLCSCFFFVGYYWVVWEKDF